MTAIHWHSQSADPNRELLLWRLLFGSFLAVTSLVLHSLAPAEIALGGLLVSLGTLFASLGVAWLWLGRNIRARLLLIAQLGTDMIVIAALVRCSGGRESAFPLLYCVPIMLGAHYLGSRGVAYLVVGASLMNLAAHFGNLLGWWLGGGDLSAEPLSRNGLMILLMQQLLFILVGIVSGVMADSASRRQQMQAQAERQAERAQSEVRNILDNLRSGLVSVDTQGIVNRVNVAAEAILGLEAAAVVGRPLASGMGERLRAFANLIQAVAEGAPPVKRSELNVAREDGSELPLGLGICYLEDQPGHRAGAIAIFQDLTEVCRMREHLRRADKLAGVGELAASIAHEIRNPLASIRGSAEILVKDLELTDENDQLLRLIMKESKRVNNIIEEFLSFARFRPAELQPVPCAAFLADMALQVRQHVGVNGDKVRWRHRVEPQDLVLQADPEQIRQLLLNLAINACEAMEYEGELQVIAEAIPGENYCEMRVSDTGPGIPESQQQDLFKPFVTTKKGGTGLGLPMVARIAHAHGSSIEMEEAPHGGAAFRLRLPTLAAAEDTSAARVDHGEDVLLAGDRVAVPI